MEVKSPGVNYPDLTDGTMFQFGNLVRAVGQDETKTEADAKVYAMTSCLYKSVDEVPSKLTRKEKKRVRKLNDAPASCHGFLMKFPPGTYCYMCTRNNQFSNRNQKGCLTVN